MGRLETMLLFMRNFHLNRILAIIFLFLVFLFMVLPIIVILPISLSSSRFITFPPKDLSVQWFLEYFTNREWLDATFTTIKVALLSTTIAIFLGVPAAYGIHRSRFRGKRLITTFMIFPMIMPSIIFAIGIYYYFSNLQIIDTVLGLVIAHTILSLPLVIIIILANLRELDQSLEYAAQNLGASPMVTFIKVTLPLIKSGLIASGLLSFATSFDEIVVSIFLCNVNAVTLPKKMWDGIRFGLNPTITVASVLFIFTAFAILVGIRIFGAKNEKINVYHE
jgi:ABC-type spermidine/putrescine transport system permease subunit II